MDFPWNEKEEQNFRASGGTLEVCDWSINRRHVHPDSINIALDNSTLQTGMLIEFIYEAYSYANLFFPSFSTFGYLNLFQTWIFVVPLQIHPKFRFPTEQSTGEIPDK